MPRSRTQNPSNTDLKRKRNPFVVPQPVSKEYEPLTTTTKQGFRLVLQWTDYKTLEFYHMLNQTKNEDFLIGSLWERLFQYEYPHYVNELCSDDWNNFGRRQIMDCLCIRSNILEENYKLCEFKKEDVHLTEPNTFCHCWKNYFVYSDRSTFIDVVNLDSLQVSKIDQKTVFTASNKHILCGSKESDTKFIYDITTCQVVWSGDWKYNWAFKIVKNFLIAYEEDTIVFYDFKKQCFIRTIPEASNPEDDVAILNNGDVLVAELDSAKLFRFDSDEPVWCQASPDLPVDEDLIRELKITEIPHSPFFVLAVDYTQGDEFYRDEFHLYEVFDERTGELVDESEFKNEEVTTVPGFYVIHTGLNKVKLKPWGTRNEKILECGIMVDRSFHHHMMFALENATDQKIIVYDLKSMKQVLECDAGRPIQFFEVFHSALVGFTSEDIVIWNFNPTESGTKKAKSHVEGKM